MTPTEQAARWLADVPRHADSQGYEPEYILEADALAAIARHLAPGDDLVKRATAAMEGVTPGPWRVDGEPWNQIVWSGADNRVCFMAHSNGLDDDRDVATARFIAFTRQWVPEAAARLSALTAQNNVWQQNSRSTFEAMVAMRDSINEHIPMPSLESDLLQGPENSVFCAAVAEAVVSEVSRLRDRLALVEGTLNKECDLIGTTLEMKLRADFRRVTKHHGFPSNSVAEADIVRAFLATLRAALTDGGSNG